MTSIGFTGTRTGMSVDQRFVVDFLLTWLGSPPLEFHFGDCEGADVEAAEIARLRGLELHRHPPNDPKHRAFVESDVDYPEKPYLERNRDIVDASGLLIAAPKSYVEQDRGSGTWATVRCARQQNRRILIAYPNGRLEVE